MTYAIDFEFYAAPGECPRPWCLCWVVVETGEEGRLWIDGEDVQPPGFTDDDLVLAHYALAEMTCYRALGWKMPPRVVDTYAEVRVIRGQVPRGDWKLLTVCHSYGIETMSAEHKDDMRSVAIATEVAPHDREPLMEYCIDDCRALAELWRRICDRVELPLAEVRGRYVKALARVENRGIPVDSALIEKLQSRWPDIRRRTKEAALETYPVTFSDDGAFSSEGWLRWCHENNIPWPRLPSGAPKLDQDTFRKMAQSFHEVEFMHSTRRTLSASRAVELPMGQDSRLRCMMSPFQSSTGRNQPSNSKYVFGMAKWLRGVIQAPPGRVLAYIDYSSQEFAIAAALSGDERMMSDYLSGDPYMALAKRARAVPAGATKATHGKERNAFKLMGISAQYGAGPYTLAGQLGTGRGKAVELLAAHREAYGRYWEWREAVIDHLLTGGTCETRFGWKRKAAINSAGNSLGNFPVQANGSDILRLAVIALEEAGHEVVATVHDAVLLEMDEEGHEAELAQARYLMERAGQIVAGVSIRTDAEVVLPLEHYKDDGGREMWEAIRTLP